MQERLSGLLENILGLLLLEGSYEIQDTENGVWVMIETKDAGRLIGFKGENLQALQLLVNQIMIKYKDPSKIEGFRRVILDVGGWRQNKEKELKDQAKDWATKVLESSKEIELEPMPPWQRRIVHLTLQDIKGVSSESIGEGQDRHLIIKPGKKKL